MQRFMKQTHRANLGAVCMLAAAFCAAPARGNVVGYNQVNNFAASFVGYSGGGNVQLTEGLAWSGGGVAPPESSASWTFGSPTDIRSVMIFPNAPAQNVTPADYNFQLSRNGVPVHSGTIADTPGISGFKPTVVNVSMLGTTTFKTETTDLTRTACCGFAELRDIFPTLAFPEAMGPLVSPSSVSSDVGWNNLNLTIDDARNVAITTIGAPVSSAFVTFDFGAPRTLSGVLVNINPIDAPTPFAWHTWDLKDAPGGTILATKGTSTDRYQLLEFAGGPITVSSITLEGPMNPDTGSSGRGRLGELWGIEALLPQADAPLNVDVGSAMEFTTALFSDAVSITNVGDLGSRLDLFSYSITGSDAGRFALDNFSPTSLRVGEIDTALFDLEFSPLAATTSYSALLTFQTNAGPISINLFAQSVPVPEPSAVWALSGLAVLVLGGRKRRR